MIHEYFKQIHKFECSMGQIPFFSFLEYIDVAILEAYLSFNIADQRFPNWFHATTFLLIESFDFKTINMPFEVWCTFVLGLFSKINFAFYKCYINCHDSNAILFILYLNWTKLSLIHSIHSFLFILIDWFEFAFTALK